MTVKVKFKGDKIKVQAGEGYCSNVKDLLILKDNGNGYFVKRKSYVSHGREYVEPQHQVRGLGQDSSHDRVEPR